MPSDNQPIITFHEYPGGPPITFREHRTDAGDGEEEPRSYFPRRWVKQQQGALLHLHGSFVDPGYVISRELALAAARQALLTLSREHEALGPAPAAEMSTEQGAAHDPLGELRNLKKKVAFLEAQLESQSPHLPLYRLGAGSLLLSVISIVVWLLTGAGIPFHPIFAAGVIPVSLGVIAMAFLVRTGKHK